MILIMFEYQLLGVKTRSQGQIKGKPCEHCSVAAIFKVNLSQIWLVCLQCWSLGQFQIFIIWGRKLGHKVHLNLKRKNLVNRVEY